MAIDSAIITPATYIQVVPTVTATSYTTGMSIGGLITFTGAARSNFPFNGGLLQSVTATFSSGVTPALDLILFNSSPGTSTITDHTAIAVAAADLSKVVGVIHMTDSTNLGTGVSVVQSQQQALPFNAFVGTTLWAALVIRASATLTSTSDCTLTAQILQY